MSNGILRDDPDPDVLIAGAGAAGALCARACALAGLRVWVLEQAAEGSAGRPVIADIERSVFERTGVAPPAGDEIAGERGWARYVTGKGREAFRLMEPNLVSVIYDRLVGRLLGAAEEAGAEVKWRHKVRGPLVRGRRVVGLRIRQPGGDEVALRARMVVDATGNPAVLTRALPEPLGIDFDDLERDRVLAYSRVYRLDRKLGRRLAARPDVEAETIDCQLAMQGAYSTFITQLSPRQGMAMALVGVKADVPPVEPRRWVTEWEQRLGLDSGVIAEVIAEGEAPIRIRRASLRLVADGFATVGEAAGMVVPMHGSGVASAMLSGHELGRHLGRVLASGGAATTESLWPWAVWWQRGRGAVLASYDANRRLLERFTTAEDLDHLLGDGVLHPDDPAATFQVRPLRLRAESLPQRVAALGRHPLLGARVLSGLPAVMATEAWWRRYPRRYNPVTLAAWQRVARRLVP